MESKEILALFDQDERINARAPGVRREVDGPVIRNVMEAAEEGLSAIPFSDFDEAHAGSIIAREIDYFARLKRDFAWPVYAHDRVADLGSRLVARGFEREEANSIMVLALDKASTRLPALPTADVRRLDNASDLEAVRGLLSTIWGTEFAWFVPRMTRLLASPGYLSMHAAYVDGELASAAWTYMNENSHFVGLYGGSTLPQFRGQGLYTALVAARAQEAIQRGRLFLLIDAGDMSRPIIEKQGFRELTRVTHHLMEFEGR